MNRWNATYEADIPRRGRALRPAATFSPAVVVADDVTRVLVEQLRTLGRDRLTEHVGRLAPDEHGAVDEALELVLGV